MQCWTACSQRSGPLIAACLFLSCKPCSRAVCSTGKQKQNQECGNKHTFTSMCISQRAPWPGGRHSLFRCLATEPRRLCQVRAYPVDVSKTKKYEERLPSRSSTAKVPKPKNPNTRKHKSELGSRWYYFYLLNVHIIIFIWLVLYTK